MANDTNSETSSHILPDPIEDRKDEALGRIKASQAVFLENANDPDERTLRVIKAAKNFGSAFTDLDWIRVFKDKECPIKLSDEQILQVWDFKDSKTLSERDVNNRINTKKPKSKVPRFGRRFS